MKALHDSAADILTRVSLSLDSGGDFPTQRKTLDSLRAVYNADPLASKGTHEALLGDPIASIRALRIYSSIDDAEHYSLSQYIRDHGIQPLLDLEFSTLTVSDYREIARANPIFLDQLRKSLFAGLLASLLMNEWGIDHLEELLIASAVLGCGDILLSYYEPRLYTNAIERSRMLKISLYDSLSQVLGMPLIGLSISSAHALGLPESLLSLLDMTYAVLSGNPQALQLDNEIAFQSQALAVSYQLAQLLSDSEIALPTQESIPRIAGAAQVSDSQLQACVENLPSTYAMFCKRSLLPSLGLPSKLDHLLQIGTPTGEIHATSTDEQYATKERIEKMQRIVSAGGTTKSIIASALETLIEVLPFDRVILFLPDPELKRLYGSQLLGVASPVHPHLLATKLNEQNSQNMLVSCFQQGRIIATGQAFLGDATLSVCIPVGLDSETLGVILCDRVTQDSRSRETLGNSVMKELRILTSSLHDCLLLMSNAELRAAQHTL